MAGIAGTFRVDLEGRDEPLVVAWDSRSLRAWEAREGVSWLSNTEPKLGDLVFVAWDACRRRGRFEGTFDEFDDACLSVEAVDDPAPKGKSRTRKGRGAGQ